MIATIIIIVAAVLAPAGVMLNTKLYEAGEKIYLKTNSSLNISNPEVSASVQDNINGGLDALHTNIDINADLFQYSWVPMVVLSAIVLFVFVLRVKEISGGGLI